MTLGSTIASLRKQHNITQETLAQQLGEKGIRVNAVAPGPYWTPLQSSGGQPQETPA